MFAYFLARVFLLTLTVLNTFGFYWFAFGLWPISWPMFVLFSLSSFFILATSVALEQLKGKK